MKKLLSLLFAAVLLLSLAGCNENTDPTESITPTASNASAGESAETEPLELVTAEVDTVVLRDSDIALRNSYAFVAIDPEAPFVDIMNNPVTAEISINDTGADALARWLFGEEALTTAGEFGISEYGEAVYTLAGTAPAEEIKIPAATGKTGLIRLFAPKEIVDSGLLEELLPVFEEKYGYTVELHDADADWAMNNARRGKADLLLIRTEDLDAGFLEEGFARIVEGFESSFLPYLYNYDVLCGPAVDPAGVRDAASLSDAFASIAYGHYTFVSPADSSRIHALELTLWPEALGITEEPSSYESYGLWYVGAATETGPALVMAEEKGGYLLADRLTFLKWNSYIRVCE